MPEYRDLSVLHQILRVCDDHEANMVTSLANKAFVIWSCRECAYDNYMEDDYCDECGHPLPMEWWMAKKRTYIETY